MILKAPPQTHPGAVALAILYQQTLHDSHMAPENFVRFLHQNYLEFTSSTEGMVRKKKRKKTAWQRIYLRAFCPVDNPVP